MENSNIKLSLIRKKLKNRRFLKSLCESGRYKEIYYSREALYSFIITFVLIIFLTILYCTNKQNFIDSLPPLILAFIGGFIALIAFSLSALALTISAIGKTNLIKTLKLNSDNFFDENSEKLLEKLITTLYRFYFSAGFNLISILILVFSYFYLIIPMEICVIFNALLGFIVIYTIIFSLLFTLTLFSTCIKLPFYF
ncbi:hypothetical protein K4T82_00145 [Staphylococcus epidermidis]|jgi:hypothetical protein|uniref:hypothetical protein n=1 Tax=Staphylococcus TaxID=1279 RepID=UPI0012996F88|nr:MULTISPECIES: hypothetical protein [Staphylococcus]DAS95224.1 MAG TPA: hypothetical protein [Bacteriophage sp.]KAB2212574.1 hypothetical protein F9B44_05860 [Staphylococcus epidermidis]MBE9409750.1 hypothetical protein [Staphylococcus epidermidis]MBF2201625.1 hypothetical protein [Staphylococcus epidermidis]MBF2302361.1 hypothetical protein [Staphylococcus epidermidis]